MIVPLIVALALAPATDDPPAEAPPDLNDKVLSFARSKMGEMVGDGECSSLARAALREAGARVRFGRGGVGWGEPLDAIEDAKPGDILQFQDVTFTRSDRLRNGGKRTRTFTFLRHTAIVAAVKARKAGAVVTILHQNAGYADEPEDRRRRVSEWTLDMADLKGGTLTAYRPVEATSRDGSARAEPPGDRP